MYLRLWKCLSVIVMTAHMSVAFGEDSSSGCGPGWKVTNRMSFSGTTTRGTTNSYVVPFALTSGTSGCAKHTLVMNDRKGIEFLAANYELVSQEAARGSGEYLVALSRSIGCREGDFSAFQQTLRANYGTLFTGRGAEATYLSIKHAVAQGANGCLNHGES